MRALKIAKVRAQSVWVMNNKNHLPAHWTPITHKSTKLMILMERQ